MIGGPDEAVSRLDPIFATLAPGVDSAARTPGRDGEPSARGAGLPPLRSERRRPLREDGPQRDRVRGDGRVRRGAQHPAQRERRQGRARGGRRDRPAGASRVLPVRPRPPRGRRGVAAGQRDRLLAAGPDRRGAAGVARPLRLRRSGVGLGRGALDVDRRDRGGRSGARLEHRRCIRASPRAASTTSPTRCCRRCASSSAATPRRPLSSPAWPR